MRPTNIEQAQRALSLLPIFSSLSAAESQALASTARTKSYPAETIVVQQGDPGVDVFVILSGRLRVVSRNLDGGELAISLMGPGEFFGEVALLDRGPRSASVIAQEPSELLALSNHAFESVMRSHPEIALKIMRTLASRLRRLTERSEEAAFLDVPKRLAKTVLRLAQDLGVPRNDGSIVISLRITQTQLGALAGATRESVNKCLRVWQRQKLVVHGRRELTIVSPLVLRAWLESA